MKTTKKVAVINGATGGIGSAIAENLVNNGYDLALLGRSNEKLNALATKLRGIADANIATFTVDVRNATVMSATAAKVMDHFQQIEVLINSVGIVPVGGLLDVTEEQWLDAIQTSLLGPMRLVTNFSPIMKKNKTGKIVLINGVFSIQPEPDFIISSTITGGINNFAKAISKDLGKFGILVNTLNPGATETLLWEKITQDVSVKYNIEKNSVTEQTIAKNPLGRIGSTTDIANVVEFLCSEKATYLNGSFITIDGGYSASI